MELVFISLNASSMQHSSEQGLAATRGGTKNYEYPPIVAVNSKMLTQQKTMEVSFLAKSPVVGRRESSVDYSQIAEKRGSIASKNL